MNSEQVNDARQQIEKVVADYRNVPGRTNYDWQVQKQFAYGELIYICGFMMAGANFLMLFAETYTVTKIISAMILMILLMFFIFKIATLVFKRFQEKVWHNDTVSERDILYLCENPALKTVIAEDIRNYPELTYSFLLSNLPRYSREIALAESKMYREGLLQKICGDSKA
ncbi:TPA: hypothetical protein QIR73_002112 [Enterobacter cloacae]|nr:hypothetical protein [Enterobacter cloacae]